jgi:hypothetical protein
MLFSFIYLVFVSLLKLLVGSRRSARVKDIELVVPVGCISSVGSGCAGVFMD